MGDPSCQARPCGPGVHLSRKSWSSSTMPLVNLGSVGSSPPTPVPQ